MKQGAQGDPDSATFCQSIDNKDNWVRGIFGIYEIWNLEAQIG